MLTWTCEVCGRTRDDDQITVTKHAISDLITRNVRHCADNEVCIRASGDPGRWALGHASRSVPAAPQSFTAHPLRRLAGWLGLRDAT